MKTIYELIVIFSSLTVGEDAYCLINNLSLEHVGRINALFECAKRCYFTHFCYNFNVMLEDATAQMFKW